MVDANDFLDSSIEKVLHTLLEAFILVFIVVFVFLQNFRATLIPAISVPVSIIGTFFFLNLFGFTLTPIRENIDAYNIYRNYFNRAVKITLTNKVIKYGIIIKEIKDANANRINAWKFVPNHNAIAYQKKNDDRLTETIMNATIQNIEAQS